LEGESISLHLGGAIMVRLSNQYLQEEEHQEAQTGTLLGEIGGWVALECDCRATLVLDVESADQPSRCLLACGVCGKRFARRSGY
jgi:hypothetical protein